MSDKLTEAEELLAKGASGAAGILNDIADKLTADQQDIVDRLVAEIRAEREAEKGKKK